MSSKSEKKNISKECKNINNPKNRPVQWRKKLKYDKHTQKIQNDIRI
jgi:hypothetical protein